MSIKSDRLKKFESELTDLEEWLRLGLVPKKDLEKHKEEIAVLGDKIDEEKARLRFLKESGESEEFIPPKRPTRQAFQEPQSMPDVEAGDAGLTDAGLDMETEAFDSDTTASGDTEEGEEGTVAEESDEEEEEEEEEDPFSDRNRWRRGILKDPDAGEW